MINLLVADDQTLVRQGLVAIIEDQGDMAVVGEASDGAEAVTMATTLRPDVVLMDVRMPRLDGIEATRRILAGGNDARVLVLTTCDLNEYVYKAMRAGASGFLLKDVPAEQLLAGIRIVAAGDALLAPAITKRLIEQFVRRPPPAAGIPDALSPLSEREIEVLKLVARGLSNAEIAGELYLSDATVKTHVGHILAKLQLRDRVHAVVLAYESGLIEPGGDRARGHA